MSALLAWFAAARWRMSLSHCLEGFLIFLPCAALTLNWCVAALCVVVWYWAGKHYECMTPGNHAASWTAGWLPWQWSKYQVLDVTLPAIWFGLLSFALNWFYPLQLVVEEILT